MIEEKHLDFLKRLTEKTVSGKAKWEKTNRENEFFLKLPSGSVSTDSWDDEDGRSIVDFAGYNRTGEEIFKYKTSKIESLTDYNMLKGFYNVVRSKYLKADETLNKMMKELDKQ